MRLLLPELVPRVQEFTEKLYSKHNVDTTSYKAKFDFLNSEYDLGLRPVEKIMDKLVYFAEIKAFCCGGESSASVLEAVKNSLYQPANKKAITKMYKSNNVAEDIDSKLKFVISQFPLPISSHENGTAQEKEDNLCLLEGLLLHRQREGPKDKARREKAREFFSAINKKEEVLSIGEKEETFFNNLFEINKVGTSLEEKIAFLKHATGLDNCTATTPESALETYKFAYLSSRE